MGQSRAKNLFDLTSTVTDDSDSQFMNMGEAIDQNINAMGIDDDPVSTIDLSALNQLFNNVLAPTFSPQPSTATKQLPPMLLQQQQPMLLPPPQKHLDHMAGTDGGLATDQTSTSVTSLLFSLLSDLSASVQEIIKSLALRALSQLPPIAIPSGSKKTIIHHLPVAKERTTRSSGKGRHQSPMVVPVEEEEDVLPGGGGEEKDEKEDEEDEDCVPSTWDIPLSVKTFMQDDRATDPHNEYDIENIADDYVENITRYFDTIPYAIIEISTFKFFSEEALVFLKKHNATKLTKVNIFIQPFPTI